jgi:WD repeat-containing protein 68
MAQESERLRRKEIYTYSSPWVVYALHWSTRPDQKFRLALGSFTEDYTNKVEIVQLNEEFGDFDKKATFDHPYPATKVMWIPDKSGTHSDLLATTGDYLRLWELKGNARFSIP